jgi:Flp pilus assembly protein TadB
MSRLALTSGLALWCGATLLLSTTRWSRRRSLAARIRPYVRSAIGAPAPPTPPLETFRDLVAPLSQAVGDTLARGFGVHEDLAARLRRVHSAEDVTSFRIRQVGWAVGAVAAALGAAVATDAPPAVGALAALGAPLLAFLVVEQRLARASARWQRRLTLELPVVCEQIGLLLGAGTSLSGALARIATRGDGACARDLRRVGDRIRQGLDTADALHEWAATARVEAVDRLVRLLALDSQAGDLAHLVGEEARAMRRDLHRDLVAAIHRRAEQVWIPVTVAALVPGVILLAVPFTRALTLYATS